MMKNFLENGNLEPGIHTYSIKTFEEQFVMGFPGSVSRRTIYDNFIKWLEMLTSVAPPRHMWLNGSYLTQKLDPNDMDLIVFYRPEDLTEEIAPKISQLVNQVSRTLRCDAYICYTFEHWEPQEIAKLPDMTRINRTYWMGQFGFDRQQAPKGIVNLPEEEIFAQVKGGVA